MKKIFIAILFISITFFLRSQTWEALGNGVPFLGGVRAMYADTVDNYLYTSGLSYWNTPDGRRLKGIGRWDGVKWDSVGSGLSYGSNAFVFERYHDDLYVGGTFDSVGHLPCKAMGIWKGTYWDTLVVQPFKKNSSSTIITMEVIDSELYFGGVFDSIIGVPCRSFAKWNGTVITPIGFPSNVDWGYVFAIQKYGDYIYIGGNFSSDLYPDDTIQDIMRYDGTNWSTVGGGMKGGEAEVAAMAVYHGDLYVAGDFSKATGNAGNNIQKWDGTSWNDVSDGTNSTTGYISKLIVYHDKLYAMGKFVSAGGLPASRIASWDGTNWCSEGSIFDNGIGSACIYNDSLFIGGGFWTINGDSVHHVVKYTGDGFTAHCTTNSIDENYFNDQLDIYPNPATNQITVEFTNQLQQSILEIKNILGQRVYSETIKDVSGKQNKDIDVSNLSKGIYFLSIKNENGMMRKKFVKQ